MDQSVSAGGDGIHREGDSLLPCVELETGPEPKSSVIWLHGLGADGHDFEPIVPMLVESGLAPTRFVFPHAPIRPVTINGGMEMRAWYDIRGLQISRDQDVDGIEHACKEVRKLISREMDRGIASEQIVIAGFSQGGAIAGRVGLCFDRRLAGMVLLSCYLLLEGQIEQERSDVNRNTAVFAGHGSMDPVVPVFLGRAMSDRLKALGNPVEWHEYPMPHSVSPEEIAHIGDWLVRQLQGQSAE